MRGRDASAAASGARTVEGRSSVLVSEDKIRLELLAARHPAGRDHPLENILLLLCYCSGGALATCKEGRHGGHHVQADIQRAEETLEGLRQMLAILSNL